MPKLTKGKVQIGMQIKEDTWKIFNEMVKKLKYNKSEFIELILSEILETKENHDGSYSINFKLTPKEVKTVKKDPETASPEFLKAWEVINDVIKEDKLQKWTNSSKKETLRLVKALVALIEMN
jgi:hypothetical protein